MVFIKWDCPLKHTEVRFFIYLIIYIDKLKGLIICSLLRLKVFNVNFNHFKLFIENKCLNCKNLKKLTKES